MTALAVAHLAADPRFDDLVTMYRNQLGEMSEGNREKFENLVTSLRTERP